MCEHRHLTTFVRQDARLGLQGCPLEHGVSQKPCPHWHQQVTEQSDTTGMGNADKEGCKCNWDILHVGLSLAAIPSETASSWPHSLWLKGELKHLCHARRDLCTDMYLSLSFSYCDTPKLPFLPIPTG